MPPIANDRRSARRLTPFSDKNDRCPGHVSTATPGGRSNACDARTGTRRTIRDNVCDGDEAAPACRHHRRGLRRTAVRQSTARQPVDVVLVDRHNYHLFTPLLYQVASCLLNPSEIAAPLRKVLRGARERPLPRG